MGGFVSPGSVGDSVRIFCPTEVTYKFLAEIPACPKCTGAMAPRDTWDGKMRPGVVCGKCGASFGPTKWGVK